MEAVEADVGADVGAGAGAGVGALEDSGKRESKEDIGPHYPFSGHPAPWSASVPLARHFSAFSALLFAKAVLHRRNRAHSSESATTTQRHPRRAARMNPWRSLDMSAFYTAPV